MGATQARRQARFNEFIKPLHDKFQEVHLDYSVIMRNLNNGLPERIEGQWTVLGDYFLGENSESMTPPQAKRAVKAKITQYRKDRQQQEAVRDLLRYKADAILKVLTDQRERRYVYSLITYFHEHSHRTFQSASHMDSDIEDIITIGGDHFLESPSRKLLNEIRDQDSPDLVRERVMNAIAELNQRFSDVAKAYTEISFYVIEGKT